MTTDPIVQGRAHRVSAKKAGAGRLSAMLSDPKLRERFERVRELGRTVRSSEYHLTNACNIRCEGCWFFALDFDHETKEVTDLERWSAFTQEQVESGVNAALLIGGEPTLFVDRIAAFVEAMPYVTISSNGLRQLRVDGFERVAIALTLFGGVRHDDQLRAIKPSGQRFSGLLERALVNYKDDSRATFIYALAEKALEEIDETVQRIADNGNTVTFNYYSDYAQPSAQPAPDTRRLLDEALRVADKFPEAVLSHPYFIQALLTGKTEWGTFGYSTCPSISTDHPAHTDRIKNGGAPVLPNFNVYAADTETIQFCCTSGECSSCRDSQAVQSWLVANPRKMFRLDDGVRLWVEIAESYWSQFVWAGMSRAPLGS